MISSCACLEKFHIQAVPEPLKARQPGRLFAWGSKEVSIPTSCPTLQFLSHSALRKGVCRQHLIKEPIGWIQGQNRYDKWPGMEFAISVADENCGHTYLNSSLVTLNRTQKESLCSKWLSVEGCGGPGLGH